MLGLSPVEFSSHKELAVTVRLSENAGCPDSFAVTLSFEPNCHADSARK
jgi:hypothetical protein